MSPGYLVRVGHFGEHMAQIVGAYNHHGENPRLIVDVWRAESYPAGLRVPVERYDLIWDWRQPGSALDFLKREFGHYVPVPE